MTYVVFLREGEKDLHNFGGKGEMKIHGKFSDSFKGTVVITDQRIFFVDEDTVKWSFPLRDYLATSIKKAFMSTSVVLTFHGGFEFTVKVKMPAEAAEEIPKKIDAARMPPPPQYELPPELQKKKKDE